MKTKPDLQHAISQLNGSINWLMSYRGNVMAPWRCETDETIRSCVRAIRILRAAEAEVGK